MKLSIIIPAYNAEPYIYELLDCLEPQLNDETEVIIIDDGSAVPVKYDKKHTILVRQENRGVSNARNLGIELAKGEYISFIDADDLVAEDFVSQVCTKMPFDYLEMSWKSLPGGKQYVMKLNSIRDRLINPSCCTRVFSRAVIGNVRFNTLKDSAEDEDFTRRLCLEDKKRDVITDFMYFYRTDVENSASKRAMSGGTNTKRIVYYFHHVRADMTYLIDEIREEDKTNEVIVMTFQNDLPELAKYAQIKRPSAVRGAELRGEPFGGFTLIPTQSVQEIRTQVGIYINTAEAVGGITTFIYNFSKYMSKYYDIMVLYGESYDPEQAERLRHIVPVMQINKNMDIHCDTLIIQRISDFIPKNIHCKKYIQMVHGCNQQGWYIPEHRDLTVNVSEYAKETWGEQCKDSMVIHNLVDVSKNKALILVSATRIGASDKGQNDFRMRKLALMLEAENKPYIWLNFSNIPLSAMPKGFVNLKPTPDIVAYIKNADYLVQLSDPVEAFGYSCIEALSVGTPIITTEQPALKELGYIDGVHGHTVPDDMEFDIDILWDIPKVKYKYDNKAIVEKWRSVLGDTKPTHSYKYDSSLVSVRVLKDYKDMELNKLLKAGTVLNMRKDRAAYVQGVGYVKIV